MLEQSLIDGPQRGRWRSSPSGHKPTRSVRSEVRPRIGHLAFTVIVDPACPSSPRVAEVTLLEHKSGRALAERDGKQLFISSFSQFCSLRTELGSGAPEGWVN